MQIVADIIMETWNILLDSSIYILFGILIAGIMKTFLTTEQVFKHLGKGRHKSVLKAAFFGVPLPI